MNFGTSNSSETSLLNLFFFPDLRSMEIKPDHKQLLELAHAKIYFGKYKGRYLSELPEHYLLWFRQQGFPAGKLGAQLQQVLELKINGMEQILRSVRQRYPR